MKCKKKEIPRAEDEIYVRPIQKPIQKAWPMEAGRRRKKKKAHMATPEINEPTMACPQKKKQPTMACC